MKGFRRRLAVPVLCLAVGLVVFSVSYTMMGQGPDRRSLEKYSQARMNRSQWDKSMSCFAMSLDPMWKRSMNC